MISIQNVTLGFGERTIFDRVSWHVHPGSRAGLVGANGTGKTTLFRIILGEAAPEEGEVVVPRDATIGYLPQEQAHLADTTVLAYLRTRSGVEQVQQDMADAEHELAELDHESAAWRDASRRYERATARFTHMDGYAFDSRAEKVLNGLGFAEGASGRDCREFSGGWQMRICLAALLLEQPDLMLLDEPTNHLDTDSMEWLESYLKTYKGTIITVAHDRAFLDRVTDTTAVLDRAELVVYAGNYTAHLEQRAQRDELLERQARTVARRRAQIERFVERFRAKNTKATQVQSRIKMLERMEKPDAPAKTSPTLRLEFPPCTKTSLDVFTAENVSKHYGDLRVFGGIRLTIHRGEKVGMVGVNGAGKSTLLRLLTLAEEPTSGTVTHGTGLQVGYLSQVAGENAATTSRTVWDEASEERGAIPPQQVRDLLGAFLFIGDDILKPVSVLSGGERSRLSLLKLLLRAPNVLVLDEPTNHLDMATREVFTAALQAYEGTLLIVSHDRFLLDHVVSRTLEIRRGSLFDYPGNYAYFVEKRALDLARDGDGERGASEPAADTGPSVKAASHQERKKQQRYFEQLCRRCDDAEGRIGEIEERRAAIEQDLCDPKVYGDPEQSRTLGERLSGLDDDLAKAYDEWNRLCDRVAALKSELEGNEPADTDTRRATP